MGSPSDRVRCGFGAPWLSKKPAILGTNHGSTLFDPCKRPPGHRRRVARPANHARFADHVPSAALTERSGLDDLSVSRRIRDYYQLPKDIIAAAVRANFATKGNLTEGFSPPRYASYFLLGTRGASLSIDPDLWARHEWGPLWFGFQNGWWDSIRRDQWPRVVTRLASLGPQSNDPLNRSLLLVTPPDGRSILGIQLSVGVERERVIEDAVARLRRIHELLDGWPAAEPGTSQQVV